MKLLRPDQHGPTLVPGVSLIGGVFRPGRDGERRIEPPWVDTATDEASIMLEEFAATVAHELRAPLAIVQLATDTMLERADELEPDQVTEMLRTIQRNGRLATQLLGRLARVREVGAGSVRLERERIDLATIVRETTADLTDVLLTWHPTEVHAPVAVVIHADPTAVREIVFNLLSNAAKYSPRGAPIDVSVVQRRDDALVTVRDRGCGLTPADSATVFEKYQQADPGRPGVGLGLYVSRGLARAHGGDLEVRPATAGGSEFLLTLPNRTAR